jgi:hypothetical protein
MGIDPFAPLNPIETVKRMIDESVSVSFFENGCCYTPMACGEEGNDCGGGPYWS